MPAASFPASCAVGLAVQPATVAVLLLDAAWVALHNRLLGCRALRYLASPLKLGWGLQPWLGRVVSNPSAEDSGH